MKTKFSFIILLILICHFAFARENNSKKLNNCLSYEQIKKDHLNNAAIPYTIDSLYDWRFDDLTSVWNYNSKILYQNDNLGHHLVGTHMSFNDTLWENFLRYSYGYDANFNLISMLTEAWNGLGWTNDKNWISDYDANNNCIYEFSQVWSTSSWLDGSQIYYWWNSNNSLDSILGQSWNGISWVNVFNSIYTYDVNNVLQNIFNQRWDGTAWVNYSKNLYSYGLNGELSEITNQSWINSAWVTSNRTRYLYDINLRQTGIIYEGWVNMAWVQTAMTSYFYDINDVIVDEVRLGTSELDSIHYFYSVITDVNHLEISNNINVYPNPVSDFIRIDFNNSTYDQYSIELFDVSGRKILERENITNSINKSETIDLNELNPGIYFLKISCKDRDVIKKIIKSEP